MSNFKLASISLLIITILTGIAHFSSYSFSNKSDASIDQKTMNITSYSSLLGKWEVAYNSDEFKGTLLVHLQEDGSEISGYIVAYIDKEGYSEKANDKILDIKNYNGTYWDAQYHISYQGERVEIPVILKKISMDQLELSYDYYGYKDIEIWNKLKN